MHSLPTIRRVCRRRWWPFLLSLLVLGPATPSRGQGEWPAIQPPLTAADYGAGPSYVPMTPPAPPPAQSAYPPAVVAEGPQPLLPYGPSPAAQYPVAAPAPPNAPPVLPLAPPPPPPPPGAVLGPSSATAAPSSSWLESAEGDSWLDFSAWESVWDGSLQLGINGSAGNNEAFSLQAGGDLTHKTDDTVWKFDFNYVRTTAQSVTTQHNAIGNAKWEHLFASPWTLFARFYTEYDEFKAFDLRLALNGGLGYRFLDNETTKLKGRLGAGWSREIGGVSDEFVPEAVLGGDFEHQLSKRQKLSFTADYFPDWSDFADYRIVSNASWELLLDEAAHLSLKLSVIDRYDSTPDGLQPNDLNYALLLLWKL